MQGRVVHFEVPFADGDRARDFYREIFGWGIDEIPDLDYTAVSTGPRGDDGMPNEPGYINGGMFDRSTASPTGPVVTIAVESIDDTLKKVTGLGGSTVDERTPVGDMGFAAYFTDTEGNLMGLWENAEA
ncbi:MAG: VOC family protein [Actinomycetota bacterium]|nr:VOC family protein [Actinomycetota bacterium]